MFKEFEIRGQRKWSSIENRRGAVGLEEVGRNAHLYAKQVRSRAQCADQGGG